MLAAIFADKTAGVGRAECVGKAELSGVATTNVVRLSILQ
jgi:hypothetical protein